MSLATAGIDCTGSPPLSVAMEDFHSTGPAAAKALSPKLLYVRATTHVWLSVEGSRSVDIIAEY